jgi:hypothetical protein
MAFKTFADGDALPAADLNTYLMGQALVKATSSTRPSSPGEGSAVYETDTDKLVVYTTATTGWVPPWNLPWGRIGSGSTTSAQTGVGATPTDLTSLTATATLVANRYYRATLHVPYTQVTSPGTANFIILNGATNVGGCSVTLDATEYGTASIECLFTASSGSATVKAQASTTGGTLSTNVSANSPALLIIEDVGPSAAPA